MSLKSNFLKAAGIGAVAALLTAGAAFAATATTSVNVRTGPGTSYGVVDTLAPGEHVSIVGQSGGWCRVDKPGPNGWVSCAYLAGGGGYVGPRYDEGPDVNFSFGFGSPYPYHHVRPWYPRPMHGWWW